MKHNFWLKVKKLVDKKLNESFVKERGHDVCCPHCNVWSSASKKPHGFKPKDPDDGSDIMTCGNCGKNSQWVYGPGLFIHVDDMAVKQN